MMQRAFIPSSRSTSHRPYAKLSIRPTTRSTSSAHEGPLTGLSRRSNVRVRAWANVRRWPDSASQRSTKFQRNRNLMVNRRTVRGLEMSYTISRSRYGGSGILTAISSPELTGPVVVTTPITPAFRKSFPSGERPRTADMSPAWK